jgi:hypothetical protein
MPYNEFFEQGDPEILPPSEDGVFKSLLTRPGSEPLLRDVIASVLEIPVLDANVRNEEIAMATEMLNSISKDEIERAQYHSRLMFEMDMAHSYAVAREDGLKEEALHVARNALAENLSVETIARLTGLSRDEAEALRQ